ncbi:MAG: TlpA family protein disulfide reductase [Sphingobacteriaceae bacterium]|nr:TlpA family protein disulfide reductase [Sphingobacteriaceae bacterium]
MNSFQVKAQHKKDTTYIHLINLKGHPVQLSDYLGKVLYIDFWASWCGGCKIFIQHGDSLYDRFTKAQHKKIEFINISIDEDEKSWKKGVEKHQQKGVHLLSRLSDSLGAAKYFRLTGLPRYVIIDKKGKIKSFIAQTPYYTNVYEELLELIEADQN